MKINWKRIGLLIGFIVAVFAIGYLLYFLFLRPDSAPTNTNTNVNANINGGGLPQAGGNTNIQVGGGGGILQPGGDVTQPGPPDTSGPSSPIVSSVANGGLTRATALSNEPVYQATLSSDGNTVTYYNKSTGLFYRIGPDGKAVPISDQAFYEVDKATWSPDKEKAVIEYPDGANIVYDFSTGKQITLPKHWKDFSFSPGSNKIILKSIGLDEENRWIAIANTDGSQVYKLEHLGDKDATVYTDWSPNNQVVAVYTEDKSFDQQNLFFLGLNNENFQLSVVEGRGFEPKWSTAGDKLLYSVYSSQTDYKPTLWIVDAQGDQIGANRRSLKLETWADKCSFANNTEIYCAVPTSLQKGSGIFKNDTDTSPTDIYKIDLKTGFKTKIATPEGSHNIDNIIVSENGNQLYFTSKTDGRLYTIRLE